MWKMCEMGYEAATERESGEEERTKCNDSNGCTRFKGVRKPRRQKHLCFVHVQTREILWTNIKQLNLWAVAEAECKQHCLISLS